MTREKILSAAASLYARYGIKSVSMDQIAGELRISKRTLYVEFDSKDELVAGCIEYEFGRIEKFIEKSKSESSCALESIVWICRGISRHLSSVCPSFFKDLGRYMEADKIHECRKARLGENADVLLEKGIAEGDILEGINPKMIISMLVEHTAAIKPAYNTPVVMTLLRGICTPQGLRKLDTYYTDIIDETKLKIE